VTIIQRKMDCPKCGYKAGTPLVSICIPLLEGERQCCAIKRYYSKAKSYIDGG